MSPPILLDPQRSLLVIVDMQKEGCQRHGPTVHRIVPAIRDLLDRARDARVPVVFVQSVRSPHDAEFSVFGRPLSLQEGNTGVQFIEELTPGADDIIVKKHTHDCFYHTDMEQVLQRLGLKAGVGQVMVTGIGANNCVYHAVIGFHIRGYHVYVPRDCIHATQPLGMRFALHQFTSSAYSFNVTVTSAADLHFRSRATRATLPSRAQGRPAQARKQPVVARGVTPQRKG